MAENKVTVIGIAGGTGCGKTTVVKRLVEALPPHSWQLFLWILIIMIQPT